MAFTERFSDAFTNTPFTALPTHNATWVDGADVGSGIRNRIGNNGTSVGAVSNGRTYISTTLADTQAAEITLLSNGASSGNTKGPFIRFTEVDVNFWDWTGYWAAYASGTITLYRSDDDGVGHSLGTRTVTLSAGDVLRIEVTGSSISLWVNGSQQGASFTDATYPSGAAGIFTDATIDEWGDNFAAYDDAGSAAVVPIWQFTALTTPALGDVLAIIDDPSGTPVSKKVTGTDLRTLTCSNVVVQVKTVGSGTYTPTAGMRKVLAIGVGAGGGGGGGVNTDSAGGGGGGGATCIRLLTAAQIGASKGYVVGAGGGVSANGTATTLDTGGALLNAGFGSGGTAGGTSTTLGTSTAGGAGGTASNGDVNIPGEPGGRGLILSGTSGSGGRGGCSVFGFGAQNSAENTAAAASTAYGSGGGGGHASGSPDRAGSAGADGILYLIEFI